MTSLGCGKCQNAAKDGIIPVREIFKALVAIMHKGFVVIEYEIDGDDPMPGVICILAFM